MGLKPLKLSQNSQKIHLCELQTMFALGGANVFIMVLKLDLAAWDFVRAYSILLL